MRKIIELQSSDSCINRALNDEMTFVLLGRDEAAPAAIRAWIAKRIELGKNRPSDPQIRSAKFAATVMERERKAVRARLVDAPAAVHFRRKRLIRRRID